MKKLLLFLFLLPIAATAQDTTSFTKLPVDTLTHLVTYKEIVVAPGYKKDDLYAKMREWVALNFKSANNVLQMDDKGLGKLIVKGLFQSTQIYGSGNVQVPSTTNIYFTLEFTVKDEKYRVVLSNFVSKNVQSDVELPIERMNAPLVVDPKYAKYAAGAVRLRNKILKDIDQYSIETLQSIKSYATTKKADDF